MNVRNLHWAPHFLIWTFGIIATGAVLGSVIFPAVGRIAGVNQSVSELALTGARTLGFYFMIWAPGIAVVLTVKNEYERRRRDSATKS